MLEIKAIMDSAALEVFSFKCCGAMALGQNLEIQVANRGPVAVRIQSRIDLETNAGRRRIDALTPPGGQDVAPGETAAFYCYVDETLWNSARRLVMREADGREHPLDLGGPGGEEL